MTSFPERKKLSENSLYRICFAVLIIFYCVGIAGILIPSTQSLFIKLTPLALLLSVSALALLHKSQLNLKTILLFVFIMIISWLVEAAGVNTGVIFGSYKYGSGLGPGLAGTPFLIGLNWLFLVYTTSIIASKLTRSPVPAIITASLLMIVYDLAMEPAAPILDLWQFEDGPAPLLNYVSWFIISLVLHTIIKISKAEFSNRLALPVFSIQIVFFAVISLTTLLIL